MLERLSARFSGSWREMARSADSTGGQRVLSDEIRDSP
jgi:hypothetical protein